MIRCNIYKYTKVLDLVTIIFEIICSKLFVRVHMHHQQQPHPACSERRASEIHIYRNQKHLVHVSAPYK